MELHISVLIFRSSLKTQAAEKNEELPLVARLHEPQTGRVMEVSASQPGVQVYTANFLSDGER